jgi:hypothetical protein
LKQDFEKQLAKVRKFAHQVAMIVGIQHFAKASITLIVMIGMMSQL